MAQSNIPADVRERIIAAAVELYDQAGRESLPTVDQVRRAARADMNTTSAVMREWRRAQTSQAAPVAVQVPEAVQIAGGQAVAVLWQQAQELASESLRAAQAGWEAERAELDTMRQELADAYETQATELDRVRAADQAHQAQGQHTADELASVRAELAQARRDASSARERAAELAGQLTAHQEQAAALLARLAPAEAKTPKAKK